MSGERCEENKKNEAEGVGDGKHCLHVSNAGQVCCWCGALFMDADGSEHGPFLSEVGR